MEETKNESRLKLDLLLWALILALATTGVYANYYFKELAWSLRFALGIVLFCVLIGLAALTVKGRALWTFAKEAKMELHKIVWPTRDETIKITAVVAALVFAMAIILWALDTLLLWIVGWFTK